MVGQSSLVNRVEDQHCCGWTELKVLRTDTQTEISVTGTEVVRTRVERGSRRTKPQVNGARVDRAEMDRADSRW